jgi:2'-5' RNA ligase
MAPGDTFRAFFAVPFEGAVARALEGAARRRLARPDAPPGDWRVTPAERLHLTLKFLGETGEDLVPALEAALAAAAAARAPFRVAFHGWVLLPGPRDPRVLAVGVSDPTGTLPRLAADLEERAESLGFPRESRPFLAHATVARRRPGRPRGDDARGRAARGRTGVPPPASGMETDPLPGQVVDRVVLMSSTLGSEGPAYAVVAEAALRGAGAPGTGGVGW